MAFNSKNSDISNWYNGGTSVSMQPRQAVTVPRPSQIPGLCGDPQQSNNESQQPSYGIRDTDSEYVKLAKRGGQPNLLHNELDPASMADQRTKRYNPQSYQRAEWYYDENAQAESTAARGSAAVENSYGEMDQRFKAPLMSPGNDDLSSRGLSYGGEGMRKVDNSDSFGDSDYYERNEYNDKPASSSYYGDERMVNNGQAGRSSIGGASEHAAANKREQSNGSNALAALYGGGERLQGGYSSTSHSDYGFKRADSTTNGLNNSNNHNDSSSVTPSVSMNDDRHHHINRMVRENSSKSDMSKLLSFGYVDESRDTNRKGDKTMAAQRAPSGQSDYITEYQSKMQSGGGSGGLDSFGGAGLSQHRRGSADSGWSSASRDNREERSDFSIRKRVEDDRPDFFRIGSDQGSQPMTVKPPQFGRRKASAEQRPDFFGSEASYEPTQQAMARPAFGRMKYDPDPKPDFFRIGSNDQQSAVSQRKPSPSGDDDIDVLDKVSGYSSMPRSNFRRKKTDPNAGIWATTPIRPVAK